MTSILILTAGCSANKPHKWVTMGGNDIMNVEQEKRLALAKSDCMAKAYQLFQQPPAPQNTCIGNCATGFASGVMAGAAARQSNEIYQARENFYLQCMASQGWKPEFIDE